MTVEELKNAAEKAIEFHKNSEPLVRLVVPRLAKGRRLRIAKGLTGIVVATQDEPPRTTCLVNAHKILRAIT